MAGEPKFEGGLGGGQQKKITNPVVEDNLIKVKEGTESEEERSSIDKLFEAGEIDEIIKIYKEEGSLIDKIKDLSNLIDKCFEKNFFSGALKILKALKKCGINVEDGLVELSDEVFKTGQFDEVIEVIKAREDGNYHNGQIMKKQFIKFGEKLLETNQIDEAIKFFDEAGYEGSVMLAEAGDEFLEKKRSDEALKFYKAAGRYGEEKLAKLKEKLLIDEQISDLSKTHKTIDEGEFIEEISALSEKLPTDEKQVDDIIKLCEKIKDEKVRKEKLIEIGKKYKGKAMEDFTREERDSNQRKDEAQKRKDDSFIAVAKFYEAALELK